MPAIDVPSAANTLRIGPRFGAYCRYSTTLQFGRIRAGEGLHATKRDRAEGDEWVGCPCAMSPGGGRVGARARANENEMEEAMSRIPRLLVLVALLLLTVAGLGSRALAQDAATDLRYVVVTHGQASDPFW